MNAVPSSTYFSAPPDWGWLITLYFFFSGLASGCYFLAMLIDLFDRPEDRPLARLGYYISFPCIIISNLLLTLDLERPLRFWHMLIESNTYQPMFKPWSPMSVGSWALLVFGIFVFLAFLEALVEDDRLAWPAGRKFRPPGMLGGVIAVIGGLFGFYVAGYTGVLLAVTNRPIWSDTPLLGMLFVVSAASISYFVPMYHYQLSGAVTGRAHALITLPDAMLFSSRVQVAKFAAQNRVPAMFPESEFVNEVGLMSYGPNLPDLFRRAAVYVDKILKGAKPADLPVEQPTKFEPIINLKTAKQIGLTIPPTVLARADRVIR